MEFIKGEFIENPEQDQNTACNSDRKTGYIDKRIGPVFTKIPQGNKQVVFKHGAWFTIEEYLPFGKRLPKLFLFYFYLNPN